MISRCEKLSTNCSDSCNVDMSTKWSTGLITKRYRLMYIIESIINRKIFSSSLHVHTIFTSRKWNMAYVCDSYAVLRPQFSIYRPKFIFTWFLNHHGFRLYLVLVAPILERSLNALLLLFFSSPFSTLLRKFFSVYPVCSIYNTAT